MLEAAEEAVDIVQRQEQVAPAVQVVEVMVVELVSVRQELQIWVVVAEEVLLILQVQAAQAS